MLSWPSVAGEAGGLSSRAFFGVHIDLTEEGNGAVGEVVGVVMSYLSLLRQPGGVNKQVRGRWRRRWMPVATLHARSLCAAPPDSLLAHAARKELLPAATAALAEAACIVMLRRAGPS